MNNKKALKDLLSIKKVSDSLGLDTVLLFGTALGACRDKKFLRGDRDVDVGIEGKEHREDILRGLLGNGFKVRPGSERFPDSGHLPLKRGVDVDIYLLEKNGDGLTCWVNKDFPAIAIPHKCLQKERITFYGEEYTVFSPEPYLSHVYGPDWKVVWNKQEK